MMGLAQGGEISSLNNEEFFKDTDFVRNNINQNV